MHKFHHANYEALSAAWRRLRPCIAPVGAYVHRYTRTLRLALLACISSAKPFARRHCLRSATHFVRLHKFHHANHAAPRLTFLGCHLSGRHLLGCHLTHCFAGQGLRTVKPHKGLRTGFACARDYVHAHPAQGNVSANSLAIRR